MISVSRSNHRSSPRLPLLSLGIIFLNSAICQFPQFELGGYSRGVTNVGYLSNEDSVSRDIDVESHALIDLAIRGRLTPKAEVYSELRLGTNLALFDTSASYAQLRRIVISGQITKIWHYEIGDIDVSWTPFTIWNNNAEGNVGESELFAQWRELQDYENFSEGNQWRLKGAKFQGLWTLGDSSIFKVSNFISRIQASDEIIRPEVLMGGVEIEISKPTIDLAIRAQDFAVLGNTVPGGSSLNVAALSADFSFSIASVLIRGEAGGSLSSSATNPSSSPFDNGNNIRGGFWDIQGSTSWSNKWSATVEAHSVADTYISPASQSKRIRFNQAPSSFAQINNGNWNRDLSQGDLLTSSYLPRGERPWNQLVQRELMSYDARYGTASPYGKSTPNRRGISLQIARGSIGERWSLKLVSSIQQDLTPEGVSRRRCYTNYETKGHFALSSLWEGKRKLIINGGCRLQNVRRDNNLIDPVNLKTRLFDIGGHWEIIESISLLYGAKFINARGTEYLAERDVDFVITDFDRIVLDLDDKIQAIGLKWSLNDNTQATIQWQHWALDNYSINQSAVISRVLFLFTTTF